MGGVLCLLKPPRVSSRSSSFSLCHLHRRVIRSRPSSDQILQAAAKKNAALPPASTAAPASSPASTSVRPQPQVPTLQRVNGTPGPRSAGGIASTSPGAADLAQKNRQTPPPHMHGTPPQANGSQRGQPTPTRPPPQQGGSDSRSVRGPPPGQTRNGLLSRASPAGTGGRRL